MTVATPGVVPDVGLDEEDSCVAENDEEGDDTEICDVDNDEEVVNEALVTVVVICCRVPAIVDWLRVLLVVEGGSFKELKTSGPGPIRMAARKDIEE